MMTHFIDPCTILNLIVL